MIELTTLESKFLDILERIISLEEFESWLYNNQEVISIEATPEIYDELIQINYKTKEAKHDLAKTLNIDYEQLELFQIQELIKKELEKKDVGLNKVHYELDAYDLGYISFDFQIGELSFRMHNPFNIENFVKLIDAKREETFSKKFGNGKLFLRSLLNSIGTEYFRIWNNKKNELTDQMTASKERRTKEDEFGISLNAHYCYIKKEYIKSQMKKDWL